MIRRILLIICTLTTCCSCDDAEDVVFYNSPPIKYLSIKEDIPWGEWVYCDKGEYAIAANAKIDPELKSKKDASAINAICIFCYPIGQPFDKNNKNRQKCSKVGKEGDFTEPAACKFFIKGLQAAGDVPGDEKWEASYYYGYLFGMTSIKFICSTDEEKEFVTSYSKRPYTDRVNCFSGQAICAIRTQVDDGSPKRRDAAGLMNIQFKCCDVVSPGLVETCQPTDRWQEVKSCDNRKASSPLECEYSVSIGRTKATMASQTKSMQLSMEASASVTVGYNYESEALGLKSDFSATASASAGKKTGYDWSKESSDTFRSMTTTTTKISVPPGIQATLFQVVGQCGVYTVYSSTIVRVDKKTDGHALQPKPLPGGFFCDKASNMTATNIPYFNAKDTEDSTPPKGT